MKFNKSTSPATIIAVCAFAAVGYWVGSNNATSNDTRINASTTNTPNSTTLEISAETNPKIIQAFNQQKNNYQVQGFGKVKAILKDDNKGSRHQRFILNVRPNHTLLVAHNIDLAPRIDRLQKGDMVEFYGEYEYSDQGGVMHWTHHDPQGQHIDGWLKHQGKSYQ